MKDWTCQDMDDAIDRNRPIPLEVFKKFYTIRIEGMTPKRYNQQARRAQQVARK